MPKHQLGGTSNSNNITYFSGSFGIPPVNAAGVYTRPGMLGRNAFSGPGYENVDLSAFKGFHVTERVNFEFRAQVFNLFNTPQFNNPDTYVPNGALLSNATYSTGVGKKFGTINGVHNNTQRQVELALHLKF